MRSVCYQIWTVDVESGDVVDAIFREYGRGAKARVEAEAVAMKAKPDGVPYIIERETEVYEADGGLRDRTGVVVDAWGGAEAVFPIGAEC